MTSENIPPIANHPTGRPAPHAATAYMPFVNVFVVWHPEFGESGAEGRQLAEMLYRQFCRDPQRPMSPAVGVPIYFHTSASAGVAPPPIDLERARHSAVVFLVNSSMVVDKVYQNYCQDLDRRATRDRNCVLSFVMPGEGRLELGPTQQITLPASPAERNVAVQLKFAAELCRLLQGNLPREGKAAPDTRPPMLFISHAKRDAADKAEELKILVEKTSIDTFFDKAHIAAGYDFTVEIRNSIKASAVVAWQSDEYASRPWCNIELLTAKEHQRPIVVVLGLTSGEDRSFPYLGNVRTIVATGSNGNEIIAAAIREYLRKLYTDGRLQALSDAGFLPRAKFHLFRPPEPIDAALLQEKGSAPGAMTAGTDTPDQPVQQLVLYPDPPITSAESQVLSRLFPRVRFATPATIEGTSLAGMTVGLSISEPADLFESGQSPLHLLDAMVEIGRHLLCRGATVAYGGDLRESREHGFTRQLFHLIHAYKDVAHQHVELASIFLPEHVAAEMNTQQEANLQVFANFHKVALPRQVADAFGIGGGKPHKIPDDTPDHRYLRARCLTEMRKKMDQSTAARIVVGGRTCGHQGKYPGALEEAWLALRAGKPLYLVGALGGCARLLARAVCLKEPPTPLSREVQALHSRVATYRLADGSEAREAVALDELERSYAKYAADPRIGGPEAAGSAETEGPIDYADVTGAFLRAGPADLRNGLTDLENHELAETSDLDRVLSLLMKGLAAARRVTP